MFFLLFLTNMFRRNIQISWLKQYTRNRYKLIVKRKHLLKLVLTYIVFTVKDCGHIDLIGMYS